MSNTTASYDVVIMGGGFAGVCQARHLLLKIPNIRLAIVDPRSREEILEVKKIGESMVEVAALFTYKELGLYEYLSDNHNPKFGLNFHWPKKSGSTETMNDYFSIWNNRNPPIASFQIHRGRFEADLLDMNVAMGAEHHQAKVVDIKLGEGGEQHKVFLEEGGEARSIEATHLIDAAGRSFLLGRRTQNILRGPEKLWGLDNGSAWLRVDKVDPKLFHSGHDPEACATSHYYGTNHFFGDGHWLWMIPINRKPSALSIGVMFHKSHIDPKSLNTEEKFRAFLKSNHGVLSKLVESGQTIDFRFKGRVAFMPKKVLSEDNWYVLGDAAAFGDAFYSLGTTIIAFAIESVTEVVRAKLAKEKDAELKRAAFNDFNCWYAKSVVHTYRHHPRHLGNASLMSWRIYFENMWWFGTHIPLYVGKWHLDPPFIRQLLANCERHFVAEVYEDFNELADRKVNIGFMDTYRGDQLAFGYNCPHHFDRFLENARYGEKVCDIYRSFQGVYFMMALYYMKLHWRGWGLRGVLRPRTLYHFFRLLKQSLKTGVRSLVHKVQMGGVPDNPVLGAMRQEFKAYAFEDGLEDWSESEKVPLAS